VLPRHATDPEVNGPPAEEPVVDPLLVERSAEARDPCELLLSPGGAQHMDGHFAGVLRVMERLSAWLADPGAGPIHAAHDRQTSLIRASLGVGTATPGGRRR
jgi:hypothetical protein